MDKPELKSFLKTLFFHLPDSILDILVEDTNYITHNKGTKLISEGKRHHYFYFIVRGSVKSYYLKDSKEVCSWFAFENEMVTTIKAFAGMPSNETIELLEDSELIQINTKKFNDIAKTDLSVSQLTIELITEHAIFLEDRLYLLQFMSSKERYESLIKIEPQVLQRVSLTDIASFLGVSRETLSRIRAQK
ncbi:MAG: CRP-like cAMP-binding protein [Maribacter sp.]|jgi:CRP-like cAMP-binding protein